jgi:hypothetical protein
VRADRRSAARFKRCARDLGRCVEEQERVAELAA